MPPSETVGGGSTIGAGGAEAELSGASAIGEAISSNTVLSMLHVEASDRLQDALMKTARTPESFA